MSLEPRKPVVEPSFLVSGKVADSGVTVDPSLNFVHPALQKACAYWQSRRAGRAMPARDDIRPSDMRAFIQHVALVEIGGPGDKPNDFVIRLSGSEIDKTFGAIGGRALGEALPPDTAGRWHSGFNAVRLSRQPVRLLGQVLFDDKRWLMGETFLAPLGDEAVTMLFAAFAAWHNVRR